jgi:hypothetical protein
MKRTLPIALLVLLASVVTGREGAPVPRLQREPAKAPAAPPAAADVLDELKLVRQRRAGSVQDLFPGQAPVAPAARPVNARVEPPPVPVAPPLPFSYLGRMKNGERALVYLRKNGQGMVIAESGATIDNLYRVESISDSAVDFTYLPLGTKQALNLPSVP